MHEDKAKSIFQDRCGFPGSLVWSVHCLSRYIVVGLVQSVGALVAGGRVGPREPHSGVPQVAEMHGELLEFNERLHRALLAKEALVSHMRQELIDLRGPVSDPHSARDGRQGSHESSLKTEEL